MKKQLYGVLIGCILVTSSALAGVAPDFHARFFNPTSQAAQIDLFYDDPSVPANHIDGYPKTIDANDMVGKPICQIDNTKQTITMQIKDANGKILCSHALQVADIINNPTKPMAVILTNDASCSFGPSQFKDTSC